MPPTPRPAISLRHWVAAVVQGGAVLVVEVLGARMLTPYFGTSHFVWAAQILVTLAALAVGYAFGGWLGSRYPAAQVVRAGFLFASLSVAWTPWACEPVAFAAYRFSLPIAAMMSATVLFAPALCALATVSPCLVAESVTDPSTVARVSGRLAAASTLGSVLGVAGTAYWLIPSYPLSTSMLGLALVLIAGAFAAGSRSGARAHAQSVAVTLGVAGAWAALAERGHVQAAEFHEVARFHTPYSELQVWRHVSEPTLALSSGLVFQNFYDTSKQVGRDAYTYIQAELALRHVPQARSALVVGLGAAIAPRALLERGLSVRVFELDPELATVAQRHFDAPLEALQIEIGDARPLLHGVDERFDVLLVDAFRGDMAPSHLLSVEAFRDMARVLGPEGVLVMNMSTVPWFDDPLRPAVLRTVARAFRHVAYYDARLGNYFVVASQKPLEDVADRADEVRIPQVLRADVHATIRAVHDAAQPAGLVLTDDFNPADSIIADFSETARRIAALRAVPR